MLAITLAVAVIPEGLPATATIVMSLGVQRMAKKNAIVRKLPVVETLGNTTVICSDKTGTLTLNRMTVVNLLTMDDILHKKYTLLEEAASNPDKYKDIVLTSILCNNASISDKDPEATIGDPTEGALLSLAPLFKLNVQDLKKEHKRTSEQPFDSERKLMSTVNEYLGKEFVFTKGAAEELIQKCSHVLTEQGIRAKTNEDVEHIQKAIEEMSGKALRILGYAKTEVTTAHPNKDYEHDMVFVGLTGMIDPPRKEVIAAVQMCHEAGIRTIMITGDHKITARVIATELHIFEEGNTVISGEELDKMTDEQLTETIKTTTVFARVSPASKLRIIKALQNNKETVAMTGDGVNDAPALKAANIGVAMGITGTDVAKDASDMILLDDNFTTIGSAVFEGRRIYRNIQKVIQYLIAGNIAEILIVMTIFIAGTIAVALGHPNTFPLNEVLNPIQLLVINLVTDTIPCLALGLDPAEKNIMQQKAQIRHSLFSRDLVKRILLHGICLFSLSLCAYCLGNFVMRSHFGGDPEYCGMTMAFLTIGLSQVFHSLNVRSDTHSILSKQIDMNK
jgi:Ca2+-transporting ATPase